MTSETFVRWEMHAHTSPASRCARLSAEQVIEGVKENGYHGVVITDHYDPERFFGATKGEDFRRQMRDLYAGYRAALEAGARLGVTVLPSAELRIQAGSEDYLLYGLSEEIALDLGYLGDLPFREVSRRVRDAGVLVVQAHPFRPGQSPAKPEDLDGVEVFNANIRHNSNNDRALRFATEHGLIMTRGSDVHQSDDFARAHMMLPPITTAAELPATLRLVAAHIRS
jgi:predicted metal-dependent phosphoesterase TrpH